MRFPSKKEKLLLLLLYFFNFFLFSIICLQTSTYNYSLLLFIAYLSIRTFSSSDQELEKSF